MATKKFLSNNYFAQRDSENLDKLYSVIETLPLFCEQYFVGIENNTTVLTRLSYALDLRLFFFYLTTQRTPLLNRDISTISLKDIEQLDSYIIEKYLSFLTEYTDHTGKRVRNSERGKARKLSSISSLMKFFIKKGIIVRDPTISINKPKLHDKEIVHLDKNEVGQLLETAESGKGLSDRQKSYHRNTAVRDTAIVTLLLGTGIRVSELVGINCDEVNFADSSFVITRKGGNRVQLYFNQEVGGALYEYFMLRTSNKDIPHDEKALFVSLQNTRITTRAVQKLVKKYSHAITLKKITPHKLRSTYGTDLYRQTGDIYIVADVLGHKDVNTTKKHYAAISDESRREATKKVVLRKYIPDDSDDDGENND